MYYGILTHAHFDHSGGAHHFDNVLIHQDEYEGLTNAEESLTLNWLEPLHYRKQPYPEFESYQYKVPPTKCEPIENGHKISLSNNNDNQLEIIDLIVS